MTINTILLVDDEEDIRTIGEIALSSVGGWTVHLAGDGTAALEIARRERPDVILLDSMMPRMDGPATLGELRKDPSTREIPVIFLTARVQRHEVAEYLELGAQGVIAKPFDPMTLAKEVRKLIT